MSLQLACMVLIGIACAFGAYRNLVQATRWRWLLVAGQLLGAVLLALTLFPPSMVQAPQTLLVLTPGVDAKQLRDLDAGQLTVALPGVEVAGDWIMHTPDLAAALRTLPRVASLRVLGDGLPGRDHDAVGVRALAFEPSAAPIGFVALDFPAAVDSGVLWRVGGRVEGVPSAHVELLDRAGTKAATGNVDEQGRFQLSAISRVPGTETWRLRLLDANEAEVDVVSLPLRVRMPAALRGVILAGAPDAESKYLRRWALDAGHQIGSEIRLSRGIEQRGESVKLEPASLAEMDLLIVDERAWAGLSAREKQDIGEAIRSGLGVLLRVSAKPSAAVLAEWRELGVNLQASATKDQAQSTDTAAINLGQDRPALAIVDAGLVPLLRAEDGTLLAAWHGVGQGRIGIWLPRDSFRLQLAGQGSRYGTLWSRVFSTLARARGTREPQLPHWARVGERTQVCGLQIGADVIDPAGTQSAMLVEPSDAACASWWPSSAGWNSVRDENGTWPVFVHTADEGHSLHRAETREATRQLIEPEIPAWTVATGLPRWPWFLAWLAISAPLWWLQRKLAARA